MSTTVPVDESIPSSGSEMPSSQPPEIATTAGATPATTSSALLTEPPSFKVYNPPRTETSSPRDLPDSYFEPSTADLKAAQATLQARTKALADAPFQTQAVRDQATKKKLDKWPTTTIRIKFTDRTQLEQTFPSTDKIRSVYAFVRNLLREDVKPIKFILYQPPKRELKVSDLKVRDLTLFELQLAPSSVLLVKFLDDDLNRPEYPAPLDASILSHAQDLPAPPDFDRAPPPSTPASGNSTKGAGSTASGLGGEKKMPKWLKGLPGKK